jgi:hypothetical protein
MVRAFNTTSRLLHLMNYEMPVLGYPAATLPTSTGGGFIISGDAV